MKAYSFFHNYSLGNQVLALVQCEQRGLEPGPIATYPTWQERGRQVRKGERALTLCMPLTFKDKSKPKDDPEAVRVGFAYKPRWFVLSQTDGDPIPPEFTPEWSKEKALSALSITETAFDLTDGNTQGYARKRSIAVSPLAAVPHKTTFHELAHVVLGHTEEADFNDAETTPRSLREVEAECVALLCCESLGLSGAEYCRGYIQGWIQGDVIPEKSAQKIFGAADRILKAGTSEEEAVRLAA
jgi:antirestriction protein ArdC